MFSLSAKALACGTLTLITLLTGCSPAKPDIDRSVITFNAAEGDSRQYWAKTWVDVDIEGDFSRTIHSDMLIDYQVRERNELTKLDVRPRFIDINGGGVHINTSKLDSDQKPFIAMMDKGITLTLDLKQGKVLELSSDSEAVREVLQKMSRGPAAKANDMFQSPTLAMTMPAKQGTTQTITLANGLQATAELFRLTEQKALIRLHTEAASASDETQTSDEPQPKNIAATMMIDRDSGWIDSLTLIAHLNMRYMGRSVDITQHVLMRPNTNPPLVALQHIPEISNDDFPELEYHQIALSTQAETEDAALPNSYGSIDDRFMGGRQLMLSYQGSTGSLGRIALRDIKAVDNHDQPLPFAFTFMPAPNTGYSDEISLVVNPDSWQSQTQLVAPDTIRFAATADYYPEARTQQTLAIDPNTATSVSDGSNTAQLQPVPDKPNTFTLKFYGTPTSGYVFTSIPELEGQHFRWLALSDIDNTELMANERFMLAQGEMLQAYTIVFAADKPLPKQLTLTHVNRAEQPSFSRDIMFKPVKELLLDPDIAPLQGGEQERDRQEQSDGTQASSANAASTPESGPQFNNKNQLIMRWSQTDQLRCQLSVNTPDETGHTLTWQPKKEDVLYGDVNDGQLQTWVLATDDGIRSYFYGRQVETILDCQGELVWQPLSLPSAKHPWLIDVRQFPGFDAKQSVDRFTARYRFIDKAGHPLQVQTLMVADGMIQQAKTIGDAVIGEHYLRLSGELATAQQMTSEGDTFQRRWHRTYPSLP